MSCSTRCHFELDVVEESAADCSGTAIANRFAGRTRPARYSDAERVAGHSSWATGGLDAQVPLLDKAGLGAAALRRSVSHCLLDKMREGTKVVCDLGEQDLTMPGCE